MANIEEVKVPDIGDFDAVEIIEVAVSEGQLIEAEDALITLETDKAAMDVPSPIAGRITQLLVKRGDKVKQGDIIVHVEQVGADPAPAPKTNGATEEVSVAPEPEKNVEAPAQSAASEQTLHLPDLGTDGDIAVIEWPVTVGDDIEAEQSILTLESDKASMDVPSPYDGKLIACLVKVGDKVRSGQAFATVMVKGAVQAAPSKPETQKPTLEQPPKPIAEEKVSASSSSSTSTVPVTTGVVHAGPGVRRLAHQLGVDLAKIAGSGHKGRIAYDDVHQFVKKSLQSEKSVGPGIEPMPQIDFSQWGEVEVKPLSRIKKLTAKNLLRNWVSIPHVTQFDEADISELELFRNANKASAKEMGFGLTPLAFIMKAVVSSLQAYPQFNSSLDTNGTDLVYKKYFNLGVAVDTPNGLVVPVVKDVDQKGLFAIAKELGELGHKAREGKLTRADMQGSCFSISSLGSIGGTSFTPIINAPDVAILGVSKAQMKPVYENKEFVPKLMLPLALSYDHRVIDGAEAARFSRHLCVQLEDIRKLLL